MTILSILSTFSLKNQQFLKIIWSLYNSGLLSDMAAKERQSRDKQEQLVKLANSAEKARQDAIASLQEQTEALRQNYRVRRSLILKKDTVVKLSEERTNLASNRPFHSRIFGHCMYFQKKLPRFCLHFNFAKN